MADRVFKITVLNGGGYEIDSSIIKAYDGAKALLEYIKNEAPILEDGDTIKLEEVEE